MALNWTYSSAIVTTAVATGVLLCPLSVLAQTGNPWNPYPMTQARPAPEPVTPTPKPKYYQEPQPLAPSAQAAPSGPSRFAPADLDQRLSAPAQNQPYAQPYGYRPPAINPYTNSHPNSQPDSQAYFGQPQGYANGYPQGYNPMNAPPNLGRGLGGYGSYGSYGPPIIGNNGWGNGPGNNFFPFGF